MNVCYTCITGKYDRLKRIRFKTPGWDYVCFTNNKKLTSDQWEIRHIDLDIDLVRAARKVKILHYEYLKGYKKTLWIDGSFEVRGNLNDLSRGHKIGVIKHYQRDCVYQEAEVCRAMAKDRASIIKRQIRKYQKEGLPAKVGLIASGVLLRPLDDENCNEFMRLWWNEVKNHSRRDQLSFSYILWKHGLIKPTYLKNNRILKRFKHEKVRHNK